MILSFVFVVIVMGCLFVLGSNENKYNEESISYIINNNIQLEKNCHDEFFRLNDNFEKILNFLNDKDEIIFLFSKEFENLYKSLGNLIFENIENKILFDKKNNIYTNFLKKNNLNFKIQNHSLIGNIKSNNIFYIGFLVSFMLYSSKLLEYTSCLKNEKSIVNSVQIFYIKSNIILEKFYKQIVDKFEVNAPSDIDNFEIYDENL